MRLDPERLRYVDTGEPTVIGVTGDRWQIHYRGEWRDLPWHFDGPIGVTRESCGSGWDRDRDRR